MRDAVVLLGAILLFAAGAGAQGNLPDSVRPAARVQQSATPSSGDSSQVFALTIAPATVAPAVAAALPEPPTPRGPVPQNQPTVYGVFQTFNWQLYGGYNFFRFYMVPGTTLNMNGFQIDMTYYPKSLWVGPEGQLIAEFGSYGGQTAKFAFAGGGPRFRWSKPRAVEAWAHGLVGYSHFLPQTIFGGQSSFAYEVGGGVDILAHHHRIAYRLGGDMIGTRFFHTYQYSPIATVGIVYKF
jgi:hypothetical protein